MYFILDLVYLCIIYSLHGLVELMVVAGYSKRVFLKHTKQGASLETQLHIQHRLWDLNYDRVDC